MKGYSHVVVDAQTGVVQRFVKPTSGTFTRGLNSVQTGTHTFKLDGALSWQQWNDLFDGWRRILVVLWNDVPVYAGFIVNTAFDYPTSVLTVSHASFRAVLSRRFTFGIGGYVNGSLIITGQSARGIVCRLLIHGTQGSPSPVWPLKLIIPSDGWDGTMSRSYFNYAYQTIEEGIDELTNTDGGPDIDFLPRWDAGGRLEHAALIGDPHLTGPSFEYNASANKKTMVLKSLVKDYTKMATGVFALGKGSGEIKRRGEAATIAVPGGYISLDVTRSFTQVEDPDEVPLPDGRYPSLNSHAAAEVQAYSGPILEWSGDVLASAWLPTARPGANVSIFHKANHWRPAEYINRRAVEYSGDIKSNFITLGVT